ncbi:MAG: 50S ribosomal protein L11 methyltransferase [Cyanobacteriota bacterium]
MAWMELSIDTTHEAVDWVSAMLATTDYEGEINITQYVQPDLNPLSEDVVPPQWAFTICFYLPYDIRVRARVEKIDNLLEPLHRTGLTSVLQMAVVEEKPALTQGANSLAHRIGQRFIVLAPDAPYQSDAADEVTLRLKPSGSFGSGLHPATVLSLQLLERHIVPTMNALDLGSGSGILAVAMAKLGAQVLALDNDTIAVQATQDAVCRNGVEAQVTVREGSLGQGSDLGHWMGGNTSDNVPTIQPTATFDLIVANILARVHIALADDFRQALRRTEAQGGLLITGGFTRDYEGEVDSALSKVGFEAVDCERSNEWVALAHRLKA